MCVHGVIVRVWLGVFSLCFQRIGALHVRLHEFSSQHTLQNVLVLQLSNHDEHSPHCMCIIVAVCVFTCNLVAYVHLLSGSYHLDLLSLTVRCVCVCAHLCVFFFVCVCVCCLRYEPLLTHIYTGKHVVKACIQPHTRPRCKLAPTLT